MNVNKLIHHLGQDQLQKCEVCKKHLRAEYAVMIAVSNDAIGMKCMCRDCALELSKALDNTKRVSE